MHVGESYVQRFKVLENLPAYYQIELCPKLWLKQKRVRDDRLVVRVTWCPCEFFSRYV